MYCMQVMQPLYQLRPQLAAASAHAAANNGSAGAHCLCPESGQPICLIDQRNLLFRICEVAYTALIIIMYQSGALAPLGAPPSLQRLAKSKGTATPQAAKSDAQPQDCAADGADERTEAVDASIQAGTAFGKDDYAAEERKLQNATPAERVRARAARMLRMHCSSPVLDTARALQLLDLPLFRAACGGAAAVRTAFVLCRQV